MDRNGYSIPPPWGRGYPMPQSNAPAPTLPPPNGPNPPTNVQPSQFVLGPGQYGSGPPGRLPPGQHMRNTPLWSAPAPAFPQPGQFMPGPPGQYVSGPPSHLPPGVAPTPPQQQQFDKIPEATLQIPQASKDETDAALAPLSSYIPLVRDVEKYVWYILNVPSKTTCIIKVVVNRALNCNHSMALSQYLEVRAKDPYFWLGPGPERTETHTDPYSGTQTTTIHYRPSNSSGTMPPKDLLGLAYLYKILVADGYAKLTYDGRIAHFTVDQAAIEASTEMSGYMNAIERKSKAAELKAEEYSRGWKVQQSMQPPPPWPPHGGSYPTPPGSQPWL